MSSSPTTFPSQSACLLQHIIDSGPVHRDQHGVRTIDGLDDGAGGRLA